MKREKFLKCILWLPPVLWYRVIWGFSAQPAAVSGDLSDRLLYRFLAALSPAFAASDEAARMEAVELLSFLERKTAHMFLYFVLVLLLLLALRPLFSAARSSPPAGAGDSQGPAPLKAPAGAAFLLCALAAALDEYHQTFVPGRSGELRDVLVDLGGASAALVLTALLTLCRRKSPPAAAVLGALCCLPALAAVLPPPIPGFSLLCQAAAPFASLLTLPGGYLLSRSLPGIIRS